MSAPTPAKDNAAVSSDLLRGLLDRFSEVVGDGAAYATFHFAAVQEGARLAGAGPSDLAQAMRKVDAALGHASTIQSDTPELVRVAVTGSSVLGAAHRILDGIALGLIEGALRSVRRRTYTGEVGQRDGNVAVLQFTAGAA